MNKKQTWERKFDYNDYVYLRVPKEVWSEWEQKENVNISFKKLKAYRVNYQWKMENKQKSANEAAKIKKARADMKIYKTLETLYSSLLKTDNDITIYKLAKESGVSYPKVRKFWQEHNLDNWMDKFKKKGNEALKEFLYKELNESLIYAEGKQK
jgi:hypothetical protein